MMHWPDKIPSDFPNAEFHAGIILDAVQGDYEMALEMIPSWVAVYGADYCQRLEACLTPKGSA